MIWCWKIFLSFSSSPFSDLSNFFNRQNLLFWDKKSLLWQCFKKGNAALDFLFSCNYLCEISSRKKHVKIACYLNETRWQENCFATCTANTLTRTYMCTRFSHFLPQERKHIVSYYVDVRFSWRESFLIIKFLFYLCLCLGKKKKKHHICAISKIHLHFQLCLSRREQHTLVLMKNNNVLV